MEKQVDNQPAEKKGKKNAKSSPSKVDYLSSEAVEQKTTVKITFDGEAAQKIIKCEAQLKERLSKPDMGKILGAEVLSWSEQRWTEIIEENTDLDFFFAQIRKCTDRSKSLKLLKALSEKLNNEQLSPIPAEGETMSSPGLFVDQSEESQSSLG